MTPAADLLEAAALINEAPAELLNGAATNGLRALEASFDVSRQVAAQKGVDEGAVQMLWQRASEGLSQVAETQLYPAAAEAVVLLYAAGWFLQADEVVTADLEALL